jgi:hypothetical protein
MVRPAVATQLGLRPIKEKESVKDMTWKIFLLITLRASMTFLIL